MATVGSYKIAEGLDDKIGDITRLKFKGKKIPLTNKKILVSMAVDEFCDNVKYNYNQKDQSLIDEFNLYLKSRYDVLLNKKWIDDSGRKVNF
jgi:hypothetical protein